MQRILSVEEANMLAAYEPIDSEFRSQAHNKWRNAQIGNNTGGPCWRGKERTIEILTPDGDSHKGLEAMEMIFDYFPLDRGEGQTAVSSFATEMFAEPAGKLTLFQRASIRFRMSFLKRSTFRRNRNVETRHR